jgi:hypothetical protein
LFVRQTNREYLKGRNITQPIQAASKHILYVQHILILSNVILSSGALLFYTFSLIGISAVCAIKFFESTLDLGTKALGSSKNFLIDNV